MIPSTAEQFEQMLASMELVAASDLEAAAPKAEERSEEHTSELQSR